MPVAVMEPEVNEDGDKSSKKKKKQDDDKVSNNKKISDFFKTPEKEVSSKQKSLLQFFSKSNSVSAQKETAKAAAMPSKAYQHTVADIIDLSSTDKENVHKKKQLQFSDRMSVETDTVASETVTLDKSIKKKRKKKEKEENDNDLQETIEHDVIQSAKKRHEKKHNKKNRRKSEEVCAMNSVILLSDSSVDSPPCDDMCSQLNSKEAVDVTSQSAECVVDDVGVEYDKIEASVNCNNEDLKNHSDPVKETYFVKDGEMEQTKKKKTNNGISITEGKNQQSTDIYNDNTEIVKYFKKPAAEDANESKAIETDSGDLDIQNDQCSLSSKSNRKNAMKCEDMKNLLKEIKGSEVKEKKKKKHKQKHKHKSKTQNDEVKHSPREGDTVRYDCEEKNLEFIHSERKEGPSVDTIKPILLEEKQIPEENAAKASIKESLGINIEDIEKPKIPGPRNVNENCDKVKPNKKKSKLKKEKRVKMKGEEIESCNAVERTCVSECKNISYADFKTTIEKSDAVELDDIKDEDNSSVHEMSYTDFLETLENKESVTATIDKEAPINVDETEVIDIVKSIDDSADPKNTVGTKSHSKEMIAEDVSCLENGNKDLDMKSEIDGTLKLNSKPLTMGIAKFFTCKTSTPDKRKPESISSQSLILKQDDVSSPSKTKSKKKSKIKNVGLGLSAPTAVEDSDKSHDVLIIDSPNCGQKATTVEKDKMTFPDVVLTDAVNECVKQKSTFLNSLSKPSFSGKTTQSTLCFSNSGLTMSKISSVDVDLAEDVKLLDRKIPVKAKRAVKNGNKKTSKLITDDVNRSSESAFVTPVKKRGRKKKTKVEVVYTERDEEADESALTDGSEGRRRSLRKKYKVTVFQMDEDRKTPIKIKLRRCPKSSSSGDDGDMTSIKVRKKELNAKLTRAQALLEKAKKGKHKKSKLKEKATMLSTEDEVTHKRKKKKKEKKKRKKSDDSDSSSHRRSSRLVGRTMASMEEVSLENIVISSDDDHEDDDHIPVKRGRKPKAMISLTDMGNSDHGKAAGRVITKRGRKPKAAVDNMTPKKNTPQKKASNTPNKVMKAGIKLAPMFTMGKKGAEASPKKPPLDPEQARQRQQFLMSGVPEELKKQTVTRMAALAVADYPPIPTVNHVQQKPTVPAEQGCEKNLPNMWNLGSVELNMQHFLIPSLIYPRSRFSGDLLCKLDPSVDVTCVQKFQHHLSVDETVMAECLREVTIYNSAYPVHKMYNSMKQMRIDAEQSTVKKDVTGQIDMKGLLLDSTDVVVEGQTETKKRGRKSLKLQKKSSDEVVKEVDKKIEDKPTCRSSSLLWIEKYHPSKSSEVLGNSSQLKKLKSWLSEWKHLLDKEAKKARKLLMKKNKGKLLEKKDTDEAWDDDSDFDMDSDDSEDDDSLCNTMLLLGPHGCGKTSSVYALALELGFKVHEVNASSSRNGKHILSQLQEATQSHQVSSHSCHTPSKKPAQAAIQKSQQGGKMPTAFTNLFKKAAPTDTVQKEETDKGKKRKRLKYDKEESPVKKRKKREDKPSFKENKKLASIVEDSNSQGISASMNLSSTTMILFDEVDVVFDEDKGFLSAVQTFMSTTKIPIILTTADPGFTSQFDGKSEQLTFKRPPLSSVTSHLQTIALVEKLRVDPVLLSQLVQVYEGDMRRCLVCLQYLTNSGGGHIQTYRNVDNSQSTGKALNIVNDDSQDFTQDVCSDSKSNINCSNKNEANDDDDDDFVTLKPVRNKRRRIVEDDNSNSVDAFSNMFVTNKQTNVSLVPSSIENGTEAEKYPKVHSLGIDSMLGTIGGGNVMLSDFILQCLKAKSSSGNLELVRICDTFKKALHSNILYNNLCTLLPLTSKIVDCVAESTIENESKKQGKKRKRIQNDLYDSETSNDGVKSSDLKLTEEAKTKDTSSEDENSATERKLENLCLAETLSAFTNFYDSMSSMDVMETEEKLKNVDRLHSFSSGKIRGRLVAGVDSELASFQTSCGIDLDNCLAYTAETEARSTAKIYGEIDDIQNKVQKLCESNPAYSDNFVLPVIRGSDKFTVVDTDSRSIPSELRRSHENVTDSLPLTVRNHQRNIHLDYLPTLREICRTEHYRSLTNTKRRFHHYFDSITFPVKDRTLCVLSTSFL